MTSALEQALFTRRRTNVEFTATGLLHHSDAGSQGGFNCRRNTLTVEVFSSGDEVLVCEDERGPGGCSTPVACGQGVAAADALAWAA